MLISLECVVAITAPSAELSNDFLSVTQSADVYARIIYSTGFNSTTAMSYSPFYCPEID